jgi:hypothetical protein
VRSAHHHALHHRLAADKGLLAALEDRQHLNVRREAQKLLGVQVELSTFIIAQNKSGVTDRG